MVEQTASRYLAVVDEALPGFVEKLYLTGSVALGAYQPGASDIDTLIVTSRHATDDDLGILADLHAARAGRPHLDGVYLDRETLIRQPSEQQVVPFVVDGEFRTGRPCGELNPVLWLLLTRYGIPVRGPSVADLGLTVDYEALRRYNLGNLETYWAPGAEPLRTTDTVQPEAIAWCVLGPARLHFTLAHHDVVSKAGAAAYLGELFPEYADVAARAVRWRRGEPVVFTSADAHTVADSIDAVVADAHHRWGSA
ncbi:nucleotidyltransferase domain-containing protein [Actinoplanes sp. G11-F43]|uniref:nucleotidyltransferase domain-containing protein n=1 Tax=Actinoplanes sp. G11-F43 TaxID=3424130 RepID=UPI003D339584